MTLYSYFIHYITFSLTCGLRTIYLINLKNLICVDIVKCHVKFTWFFTHNIISKNYLASTGGTHEISRRAAGWTALIQQKTTSLFASILMLKFNLFDWVVIGNWRVITNAWWLEAVLVSPYFTLSETQGLSSTKNLTFPHTSISFVHSCYYQLCQLQTISLVLP